MESTALPLGQQLLIILFGPPIMAILWLFMSRGWATAVQGGTVSERTKQRQKKLFWVALILGYIVVVGMKIYAHFIVKVS